MSEHSAEGVRAQVPTNEPKCDHICLKDDGHVERGEPHFYGYESPSPRTRSAEGVRLAECRADVWNALAPLVREYGTVKLGGILREWLRIDRPPDAEPTPTDLVRQLREVLGMFTGAMAVTPQAAWEEALQRVEQLKEGMCWVCQQKEHQAVVGADLKGNPYPERIIPLSREGQ